VREELRGLISRTYFMQIAALLMFGLALLMVMFSPLDWLSPSALLAGAWAFVYALQCLFGGDMQNSILATIVVFTMTLSFSTGELLSSIGNTPQLKSPGTDWKKPGHPPDMGNRSAARFRFVILLFACLAIIGDISYAKAMGMFSARSFAQLLLMPGEAREMMYSGDLAVPAYAKAAVLFAYPGAVLAAAYYYIYRWRWLLALPISSVVLFGVTQSGRAGIVIMLVQFILAMYLKGIIIQRRSPLMVIGRWAFVPAALLVFVFVGMGLLREGFSSVSFDDVLRLLHKSRGYLFGGVSAFSYWINNIYDWHSPTLGKYSFSSLFGALGLAKREVGTYAFYAPIAYDGETSNVYTAFRSFIDDYTIVGACLFYMLSGFVIGSFTRRVTAGRKIYVLVLIPLLSWVALSPLFSATYFNSFLLSCFLPYFAVKMVKGAGA
jgi:oligosaccharide repeat unit polymerase